MQLYQLSKLKNHVQKTLNSRYTVSSYELRNDVPLQDHPHRPVKIFPLSSTSSFSPWPKLLKHWDDLLKHYTLTLNYSTQSQTLIVVLDVTCHLFGSSFSLFHYFHAAFIAFFIFQHLPGFGYGWETKKQMYLLYVTINKKNHAFTLELVYFGW